MKITYITDRITKSNQNVQRETAQLKIACEQHKLSILQKKPSNRTNFKHKTKHNTRNQRLKSKCNDQQA